eukprot:gene4629-9189_t
MHAQYSFISVFILVARCIFCSDHIHISKLPFSEKKLRIAVITAGEIRSFAYVEKSWRRYLIEPLSPFQGSIFIFAHIIASKTCPIASRGVSLLQDMAEEVEILWSSAPLITQKKIDRFLPVAFKEVNRHKGLGNGMNRGNIFDMWARRSRAYQMAVAYAGRKNTPWDLIIMVRLDTGFYSPTTKLPLWHHSLIKYRKNKGRDGIIIPSACNFYGICDRFAAGLPAAMDIYFREDWVFDALAWSLKPSPIKSTAEYKASVLKQYKEDSIINSERCLKMWFIMNNITDLFPYNKSLSILTFATVRTQNANAFCSLSRVNFSNGHNTVHWPDVMTSNSAYGIKPTVDDMMTSPYERVVKLNETNLENVKVKYFLLT